MVVTSTDLLYLFTSFKFKATGPQAVLLPTATTAFIASLSASSTFDARDWLRRPCTTQQASSPTAPAYRRPVVWLCRRRDEELADFIYHCRFGPYLDWNASGIRSYIRDIYMRRERVRAGNIPYCQQELACPAPGVDEVQHGVPRWSGRYLNQPSTFSETDLAVDLPKDLLTHTLAFSRS